MSHSNDGRPPDDPNFDWAPVMKFLSMYVVFSVIGFLVLVVLMMFVLWDLEGGRREGREREMEQERLEMERLIEANSD